MPSITSNAVSFGSKILVFRNERYGSDDVLWSYDVEENKWDVKIVRGLSNIIQFVCFCSVKLFYY